MTTSDAMSEPSNTPTSDGNDYVSTTRVSASAPVPVPTKEAQHRSNGALTETTNARAIIARHSSGGHSNTVCITNTTLEPSLAKRYRHSGSHYKKNHRRSNDTIVIIVLVVFAAVSWPLYTALVWLVNTR